MKKLVVFVVSITEYLSYLEEIKSSANGNPEKLTNEAFIKESERQQNVFKLDEFEKQFNNGNIAPGDCVIRILEDNESVADWNRRTDAVNRQMEDDECEDMEKYGQK